MYTIAINEKKNRPLIWQRARRGLLGDFEGEKVYYNLKNKRKAFSIPTKSAA